MYETTNNFNTIDNYVTAERDAHTKIKAKHIKKPCKVCNQYTFDTYSIFTQPLGIKLCEVHGKYAYDNLQAYSSENSERIGKVTAKHITQSCEIESNNNTTTSIAQMVIGYKFKPTADGSLGYKGIEFKSPIYNSANSFVKVLGGIQWLNDNEYFSTLSSDCGAHIHTGISYDGIKDAYDFRKIFSNVGEYWKVFNGLYGYMDRMPNAKMKEYFGRGYVNYARTLRQDGSRFLLPQHDGNGKRVAYGDQYLSATDNLYGTGSYDCTQHYLMFNLQHSYSLEFRLPKFVNQEQYRRVAYAMQDVVTAIEKYYIIGKDANTTNEILVHVFEKYFPY